MARPSEWSWAAASVVRATGRGTRRRGERRLAGGRRSHWGRASDAPPIRKGSRVQILQTGVSRGGGLRRAWPSSGPGRSTGGRDSGRAGRAGRRLSPPAPDRRAFQLPGLPAQPLHSSSPASSPAPRPSSPAPPPARRWLARLFLRSPLKLPGSAPPPPENV